MSAADFKISQIIELLRKSDEFTLDRVMSLLNGSARTNQTQDAELPQHVIDGIKKGREQIKNGEFTSHEEVLAKYRARFPNASL